MTSFFPDVNVWLALSVAQHPHNAPSWNWLNMLSPVPTLLFCRVTQLGLLRLLTNESVMGEKVCTLANAWRIYDQWRYDPRVDFHPEPQDLDSRFRVTTATLRATPATKAVGDCYLLSYAVECDARLVTFDKGLFRYAKQQGHRVVMPA